MNSSTTIGLKDTSNNKKFGVEKIEHDMYMLMVITSVCIIIVNYIFYLLIKFDNNKIYIVSILFTLVLPFFINIYSLFYHIHNVETKSPEEDLDELERENKAETESKIPIILFGLGLFITKLNKNIVLSIFPFLMVSLLFGTILPEFVNTLIFDHTYLYRMVIIEEIEFAMITLSYGFLITSVFLTSYFYLNPKYIK